MARKPNYKRMYQDASNLLKLKKESLPKEEEKVEIPVDFKTNGIEKIEQLMEEVSMRIQYFKENQGTRFVPPTLQILHGRLLKVDSDMKKINKSLIKPLVYIEDYEKAYNEVMTKIAKVELALSPTGIQQVEGQTEIEG